MEHINQVKMSRESVESYCEQNASHGEAGEILIAFEAAYDRAQFLRSLWGNPRLRKFVEPGTFYD